MVASQCPPTAQSGASCNVTLVGSRKDCGEYLQKCLGKATSAPPSFVVIEEIIKLPADSRSLDLGKRQASLAIEGFAPLVLALPVVAGPTSLPIQEGTYIVPTIRGFDPLILPKPATGTFGVSGSKVLEAILLRLVVINSKTFSIAPTFQTQEGFIIRKLKPFPYEDSYRVPWKYDVPLISTRTGKKVCSNISSGISGLIRSGHCYTPEELEK